MNYRKGVILLIVISTIVRLLIAAITELSNDEVYYWTYAQVLQSNYFDHPPMVALVIRLFTGNLLFQQELFIRLGAILCAAINTWLIYLIGSRIKDERTGWITACLFTASLYGSVLAGLIMLPDAPMLVCWLWAVLLMLKIFKTPVNHLKRNRRLVVLGLAIGLCIFSKVHGIFLWAGVFIYILLYARDLLRNSFLYLALVVTGIFIFPILRWNFNHDFISYTYHGSRISFFGAVQWDSFFRQIAGELAYNNPVGVVLIVAALLAMRHKKLTNDLLQQRLLLATAIPLILTVWFIALFRDTLPHWTGPAYTLLLPLAAAWITERTPNRNISTPLVVKVAVALPLLLVVSLPLAIRYLQYQPGEKKEAQRLGTGDLLLDMSGWEQFARDYKQLYQQDLAKGVMRPPPVIITDYWFPAAHLDYYVASTWGHNFLAIGSMNNIHHYAWLNTYRPALMTGQDAYYIAVSNYFDPPAQKLSESFQRIDTPVLIGQYRGKLRVRNFLIYRLHGYKGGIPDDGLLLP